MQNLVKKQWLRNLKIKLKPLICFILAVFLVLPILRSKILEALIEKEIDNIGKPELRPKVREELKKIESGTRDLYF